MGSLNLLESQVVLKVSVKSIWTKLSSLGETFDRAVSISNLWQSRA